MNRQMDGQWWPYSHFATEYRCRCRFHHEIYFSLFSFSFREIMIITFQSINDDIKNINSNFMALIMQYIVRDIYLGIENNYQWQGKDWQNYIDILHLALDAIQC